MDLGKKPELPIKESSSTDEPAETPEKSEPTPPADISSLPIIAPKPRWYKSKPFLIVLALVIITGLVGGAFMLYQLWGTPREVAQIKQTPTPTPVVTYEPSRLVYSTSTEGETTDDCSATTTTLTNYRFDGAEILEKTEIDDFQGVTDFVAHEKLAVIATTPSCASENGPTLWLSSNSGASFEKIYTGESDDAVTGFSQITSVILSSDGKSIVFGFLPADTQKNVVMSYDIASQKATELFTSEKAGVFLLGQNSKTQQTYYREGCYNCDDTKHGSVIMYNAGDKKRTIMVEFSDDLAYDTAVDPDVERVVRVVADVAQLTEFTINEYDLTTRKQANFASFTTPKKDIATRAGYTADGHIYYSADDKIVTIASDGKTSELAKLPDTVVEVYYVSDSQIVYRAGGFETGEVVNYDIKTEKATILYQYRYPSIPLGLTLDISKQ